MAWLLQNDPSQERALSYKYTSDDVDQCLKNVQQLGSPFDRRVMGPCDDLDLPRMQRARREKYTIRLHGKEQVHRQKSANTLSHSRQRDKPQRKLVIVSTKAGSSCAST